MSDPTRWRDDPMGHRPGAEILLRGARRPQPPGPHDMDRLGAAVEVMARSPVAPPVSWLRLAVAGAVAFAIAGGGTVVWALHVRETKRLAAEANARFAREYALANRPAVAAATSPTPAPAVPAPAAVSTRHSSRRHVAEATPAPAAAAAAPTPAP